MKRKMICATCGSTEVRKDGWAAWDEEAQEWVLAADFDDEFCIDCDCECTIIEKEIDDEDHE